MSITLSTPLYYDALSKLLLDDENPILNRLYDRDEELLEALTGVQETREDLYVQFGRVGALEALLESISRQIDAIIASFYLDIDENGNVADNYDFFAQLIADLKAGLVDLDRLTSSIIRFNDIRALLGPIQERISQIEDLDNLVKEKLDYIYGKWDVNPEDDIISV